MVAPKIRAEDLIALRDGGEVAVGLEIALRADLAAQFALLESRLLALAMSMPREVDAASTAVASPMSHLFDPETLAAYVRGELLDDDLARFESAVRGNPARFAELVAFKNVYFGRTRIKRNSPVRPAPLLQRVELGVLTLREIDGAIELAWDGPGLMEMGDSFGLRAAAQRNSLRLSSPMQDEELAELNREMQSILQQVRELMFFVRKSNRPEGLEQARSLLETLDKITARQRDVLRGMLSDIKELFDDTQRSVDTEVRVEVSGHQLQFSVSDLRSASLELQITPLDIPADFTWVRPGIDFTSLRADGRTVHPLSEVRREALLLIDRSGRPTSVIRVQRV